MMVAFALAIVAFCIIADLQCETDDAFTIADDDMSDVLVLSEYDVLSEPTPTVSSESERAYEKIKEMVKEFTEFIEGMKIEGKGSEAMIKAASGAFVISIVPAISSLLSKNDLTHEQMMDLTSMMFSVLHLFAPDIPIPEKLLPVA